MKKGVLRNFIKFTVKDLCQSLFFNKVAGLWHRCFPCEFCEISKKNFLQNTSGRLLLNLSIYVSLAKDWSILHKTFNQDLPTYFLRKKMIHVKWAYLRFTLIKFFEVIPKNNSGTHSPQQNKKAVCVDDICLFQSLCSRKVAETITVFSLPSFTKKDVSSIKQKKWTPPLNSAYSN